MNPLIYVVDDDPSFLRALVAHLGSAYRVKSFADAAALIERHAAEPPDAVITDLMMPGLDGIALTRLLRERGPAIPIFVVTANDTVTVAVEAMKAGATDFLIKPLNAERLRTLVRLALPEDPERVVIAREDGSGGRPDANPRGTEVHLPDRRAFSATSILGSHPLIERAKRFAERVAGAPGATVLLLGESGTGKNLVARAIHYGGSNHEARFVEINCSALPAHLLEPELFGFERGAFTDARRAKPGLIEVAEGGTLLLDEVADLSPELQAKLLSFLESRRVRRLGATTERLVHTRIVAATNRDLPAEVRAGRFREDLYYRLSVATHVMPPLRELRSDIPVLAEHFRAIYAREFRRDVRRLSREALRVLAEWSWPGNVRELRNVIERAMIFADGPALEAADLPPLVAIGDLRGDVGTAGPEGFLIPAGLSLEAVEAEYIRRTMAEGTGVTRAAHQLGISRKVLWEKRRRHGLLEAQAAD